MYNTILVPLDMSERAEAICPHVEELARCTRARVILLVVVEPLQPPYGVYPTEADLVQQVYDQQVSAAQEYLAARQGAFRDKGIETEVRVVSGSVVGNILRVAEEVRADLIAMASHGRGGLARAVYGSVAAGVLQRADRPLLLVRSVG